MEGPGALQPAEGPVALQLLAALSLSPPPGATVDHRAEGTNSRLHTSAKPPGPRWAAEPRGPPWLCTDPVAQIKAPHWDPPGAGGRNSSLGAQWIPARRLAVSLPGRRLLENSGSDGGHRAAGGQRVCRQVGLGAADKGLRQRSPRAGSTMRSGWTSIAMRGLTTPSGIHWRRGANFEAGHHRPRAFLHADAARHLHVYTHIEFACSRI